jgi:hypothetical protein
VAGRAAEFSDQQQTTANQNFIGIDREVIPIKTRDLRMPDRLGLQGVRPSQAGPEANAQPKEPEQTRHEKTETHVA